MTAVWDDWYDQTVVIEAYAGSGGMGPIYGDPTPSACLVDDTVRLVRGPDAVETVSSTTLQTPPGVVAPPGSLVTFSDAREAQVITSSVKYADDPDLIGVEVVLE